MDPCEYEISASNLSAFVGCHPFSSQGRSMVTVWANRYRHTEFGQRILHQLYTSNPIANAGVDEQIFCQLTERINRQLHPSIVSLTSCSSTGSSSSPKPVSPLSTQATTATSINVAISVAEKEPVTTNQTINIDGNPRSKEGESVETTVELRNSQAMVTSTHKEPFESMNADPSIALGFPISHSSQSCIPILNSNDEEPPSHRITKAAIQFEQILNEFIVKCESNRTSDTERILEKTVNEAAPELGSSERDHLISGIRQRVRIQRGILQEDSVLNQVERILRCKITQRNTQMYRKSLGSCTLCGRVDGIDNFGRVVEVKVRTGQIYKTIRNYDLVQIHAYMFLLGTKEAVFVQRMGTGKPSIDIQIVPFDAIFWQKMVIDRLPPLIRRLDELSYDPHLEQELEILLQGLIYEMPAVASNRKKYVRVE